MPCNCSSHFEMELMGQRGLKHLGHSGWPQFGTLPGLCILPGAQDPEVSLERQEHFRSQREMGSVSSLWSCLPSLSAFVLSFLSLLLFIYVSTRPMSPPRLSRWRVHSGLDSTSRVLWLLSSVTVFPGLQEKDVSVDIEIFGWCNSVCAFSSPSQWAFWVPHCFPGHFQSGIWAIDIVFP